LAIGAKLRSNQARFRQASVWYLWSFRSRGVNFTPHLEYAQIRSSLGGAADRAALGGCGLAAGAGGGFEGLWAITKPS